MKILHVISSLLEGGAEKLVVDLIPRFLNMGIEVEVAVLNGIETNFMRKLWHQNIKVHRFSQYESNPYAISNIYKLKRLVAKGGYSIVHAHNTPAQLLCAIALQGKKIKLVTTEHNIENRRRKYRVFKSIDRWLYSNYEHVICISHRCQNSLLNYLGDRHIKNSSIIHNGINVKDYSYPFRPIDNSKIINITMVAGFRPQKDHDTLLLAMAAMDNRYRLQLVGDGERRSTLENMTNYLGIRDRVEFLGARTDVSEILKESDIVVLSTNYEGWSLSCIEGMASGRPFIASDVPGVQELVGGHGILVTHKDPNVWKDTIENLSINAVYYRDTAIRCMARAAQFDISTTAQSYAALYSSL